jgi:thiol-disulfide isomerase/thioredoxin
MNRYLSAGAALVAAQAVLIGGYLLLGKGQDGAGDPPATDAAEPITSPMPNLDLRYVDGSLGNLAALRGRPLLLHFWATWCPPCRKELPGLLALAESGTTQVLLIALDDDWAPVRRFLDRPVPVHMALADGSQVESRFGVHELPESFVVDRAGIMTLRIRDAQDWTAAATLELLPKGMR